MKEARVQLLAAVAKLLREQDTDDVPAASPGLKQLALQLRRLDA